MQNLRLGLKLLSVIAPGIDTGAIADEIRERIGDELDYELEASNHRAMARTYRGHPFIVVPDVVTRLCRERVIVSELVEAHRFAEVRDVAAAQRDRLGEILDPLLHQRPAAPPPAQRRPASRQQPVPRRRPGRVHRLRLLQAAARRGGRADGRLDARHLRRRCRGPVQGHLRARRAAARRAARRAVSGELPGDLRLAARRPSASRSTARRPAG